MRTELNILIVEDVPGDAAAMENELRNGAIRFHAKRVETKAAFLQELQNFSPDVVLSDFSLPEFDALEALRLLQKTRRDIPFVLVTGSRSEEVAVECIKEGADDYILKSSLKRLPSSILNVLKKKEAEQEQAHTEAALRRSEEQYRLIAGSTHDLISLLDPAGRFIYASPSFKTTLGYVPEELAGTDSLALVHPENREALRQTWQEALTSKEGRAAELRVKNARDEWRLFESVSNWIFDEAGRPQRLVIVSRDVTRRQQAEETLRGLPRLIREAQEAERRRVARELHDSVNQILSSVKFRIGAMEERLIERDHSTWRDALKAKALLEKAIREVRRISRNLRPSELDDLGLLPAVRSLCEEFSERKGLAVDLSFSRWPENLPGEIELNVYRIIQEALNNIEKHARAKRVALSITRRRSLLTVTVRDDGRGFDPRAPNAKAAGMGLVDMKERATFVGGVCALKSERGKGTEIVVRIPLNAAQISKHPGREKRKTKKNQAAARG